MFTQNECSDIINLLPLECGEQGELFMSEVINQIIGILCRLNESEVRSLLAYLVELYPEKSQ